MWPSSPLVTAPSAASRELDGREAAQLAHEAGARWVVPCHYEMFAFNTADPNELLLPECERIGQHSQVLRAGQGWSVPRATTA
jgi:hypothetical protein